MKSYAIEKARNLVLRAGEGDVLPSDLTRALEDEAVACGWVRASGVLAEVDLRAFDAATGGLGAARRITGPVQALVIEGSVALEQGQVSVGLRAVLARETDRGMEVLAGEITRARVVALEAHVTAFDDLALGRALDESAGVVFFADPAATTGYRAPAPVAAPVPAQPRPVAPPPVVAAPRPPAAPPQVVRAAPAQPPAPSAPDAQAVQPAVPPAPSAMWGDAMAASADADLTRAAHSRGGAPSGPIPPRPIRAQAAHQDESAAPEAGDVVEHFAFGRSEVVKSDGDRLHLKVGKDGRIKEIALEMLKVTPLSSDGGSRRFRLDRKL